MFTNTLVVRNGLETDPHMFSPISNHIHTHAHTHVHLQAVHALAIRRVQGQAHSNSGATPEGEGRLLAGSNWGHAHWNDSFSAHHMPAGALAKTMCIVFSFSRFLLSIYCLLYSQQVRIIYRANWFLLSLRLATNKCLLLPADQCWWCAGMWVYAVLCVGMSRIKGQE